MARYGPMAEQFESAGVQVALIAAQKRGGMFKPEEWLEKHPQPFPFLLDEDRWVTKAYGVYHRLGMDAIHIARPATFVVDRQATVRWLYVGASQTDRADLEEVLEQARSIG